jgi:hypothetical protein
MIKEWTMKVIGNKRNGIQENMLRYEEIRGWKKSRDLIHDAGEQDGTVHGKLLSVVFYRYVFTCLPCSSEDLLMVFIRFIAR